MARNIPCTITAISPHDGKPVLVATTMTYWGAKRLLARLRKHRPDRAFQINEVWNSPTLRSPR